MILHNGITLKQFPSNLIYDGQIICELDSWSKFDNSGLMQRTLHDIYMRLKYRITATLIYMLQYFSFSTRPSLNGGDMHTTEPNSAGAHHQAGCTHNRARRFLPTHGIYELQIPLIIHLWKLQVQFTHSAYVSNSMRHSQNYIRPDTERLCWFFVCCFHSTCDTPTGRDVLWCVFTLQGDVQVG